MIRVQEQSAPDLFAPRAAAYPEGIPVELCNLFERLAIEVHDAGLPRFSARAILHRMRWFEIVECRRADFKINNKYSATLARWFLAKHPEMPGFFELRESRADD